MRIEGASPLHQLLHDAIEARDAGAFNALLDGRQAEIAAEYESWARIPEAIRADQDAVSRYVQSVLAIAEALEAAGLPALFERLAGPAESNPIVKWERRLAHAQALAEQGEYGESDRELEGILAEMSGAAGSAIDNLRPKALGRLGFNALHRRDYAAALDYTAQAHEACQAAGDQEGVATYYENLMSLRAIRALETDPELGQRLLATRRLVAEAQDSADAGRYQASLGKLVQSLSLIGEEPEGDLFQALLPKIYGLRGFNEYKLGNAAEARESTGRALRASEAAGDVEGVRIYAANLEAMGAP